MTQILAGIASRILLREALTRSTCGALAAMAKESTGRSAWAGR
jgi:hypothetical protein